VLKDSYLGEGLPPSLPLSPSPPLPLSLANRMLIGLPEKSPREICQYRTHHGCPVHDGFAGETSTHGLTSTVQVNILYVYVCAKLIGANKSETEKMLGNFAIIFN